AMIDLVLIEEVGCRFTLSLRQAERRARRERQNESLAVAMGAVAFDQSIQTDIDFIGDRAAVAGPGMGLHARLAHHASSSITTPGADFNAPRSAASSRYRPGSLISTSVRPPSVACSQTSPPLPCARARSNRAFNASASADCADRMTRNPIWASSRDRKSVV